MVLTESQTKLQAGDAAPDFNIKGVDDQMYSLDEFIDKEGLPAEASAKEGYLIIFMCNHCPYVKAKIDALNELQEKFGDRIAIIGINSNDPEYPGEGMENMKQFVQEKKIQFAYLLDDTQEVAKAYGAVCTPDPFLFDKERKLVFHGRINDAMQPEDTATEPTMELNINKMLNGETIEPPFPLSMGCSIKWA